MQNGIREGKLPICRPALLYRYQVGTLATNLPRYLRRK